MKKGFTLIELLVVVLIIGILSAVALPKYTKAVNKARVTEAWTYCKAFADAQEIYHLSNGVYTKDLSLLDIELPELKNFMAGSTSDVVGARLQGTKTLGQVSFSCYPEFILCSDATQSKMCVSLMPCSSPLIHGGSSASCYY